MITNDILYSESEWLRQVWLNKGASEKEPEKKKDEEDKEKHQEHEKKESVSKEKQEEKNEKAGKPEEKNEPSEKKASAFMAYQIAHLSKSASVPDYEHAVELIKNHPVEAAIATAIVLPVVHGIGTGINLLKAHVARSVAPTLDESEKGTLGHTINKHPYVTGLGSALLGAVGHPITMVGSTVGNVATQAAAVNYAKEVEQGKAKGGLLADYSYKNPRLGSFASMFVPGTHHVNATIAGHRLAQDALKSKNFMYRHPNLAALAGGLIPGSGTAYATAAAEIDEAKHNGV